MRSDREYRTVAMPFKLGTQKRIDSEQYVEGFATTFDAPYLLFEYDGQKYHEMILRSALDEADMSDVIMQYDHEGKVLARMSNGTLVIEPQQAGLFMCADLSQSQAARDMYEEIDNGLITKMSWAFTVKESAFDKETMTRTISKIKKVYDVSAVSIPANDSTEISARSFVDGVIEIEKQELLAQRQRLELAKAKYRYFGGNK